MGDQIWDRYNSFTEGSFLNMNATAARSAFTQAMPTGFSSILTALSSHTVLLDWLLLAGIRWLYDLYYSLSMRRFWLYEKLFQWLYFEAEFSNGDVSQSEFQFLSE